MAANKETMLGIPEIEIIKHYLGQQADDFKRFLIHNTIKTTVIMTKSLKKRDKTYRCGYGLIINCSKSGHITSILYGQLQKIVPIGIPKTSKTVHIRKKVISLYDRNGPKMLQAWIEATERCYYSKCTNLYSENCPDHIA